MQIRKDYLRISTASTCTDFVSASDFSFSFKTKFHIPKKSHKCKENANQKPLQTSSQEVPKRNVLARRFTSHILKKFQFSCSLSRPQNLSLSGNLSRGRARLRNTIRKNNEAQKRLAGRAKIHRCVEAERRRTKKKKRRTGRGTLKACQTAVKNTFRRADGPASCVWRVL